MKPLSVGQSIVADLLFLLVMLAVIAEELTGALRLRWLPAFGALLIYVAALAPSLLATPSVGASLFKLTAEIYLSARLSACDGFWWPPW